MKSAAKTLTTGNVVGCAKDSGFGTGPRGFPLGKAFPPLGFRYTSDLAWIPSGRNKVARFLRGLTGSSTSDTVLREVFPMRGLDASNRRNRATTDHPCDLCLTLTL